jgi:hypothetical protein
MARVSVRTTPLMELSRRTFLKECIRAPSVGSATEELPEATRYGDSPVSAVSTGVAVSTAEAAAFTVATDIDSFHEVNES